LISKDYLGDYKQLNYLVFKILHLQVSQAASSCFGCLDGILGSHIFTIEKPTRNSKIM